MVVSSPFWFTFLALILKIWITYDILIIDLVIVDEINQCGLSINFKLEYQLLKKKGRTLITVSDSFLPNILLPSLTNDDIRSYSCPIAGRDVFCSQFYKFLTWCFSRRKWKDIFKLFRFWQWDNRCFFYTT